MTGGPTKIAGAETCGRLDVLIGCGIDGGGRGGMLRLVELSASGMDGAGTGDMLEEFSTGTVAGIVLVELAGSTV
jgi:hypothetical protein